MRAVQRVPSFRRERRKQNEAGSSNENEHGQRRLSDTFHPLIDKDLEIHAFNKFISHNDNAYDISTRDGDKMQALNAIFNFPSPSEDVKVRGTEEIPMEYIEHIGKNIEQAIHHFEEKEVIGEITIVIKGISKDKQNKCFNELEIKNELNELINAGLNLSAAAKYLAKKNKLKKSIIYNMHE